MPNDNQIVPYSDGDILDLIEDFLVNHFGVDERRTMPNDAAFQMLEHIDHLVELRRDNSQQRGAGPSDVISRSTEDHARS